MSTTTDFADEPGRTPEPPTPLLRELGDYRIVREVGRGGMGVVYEAEQISPGRRVALKVLPGRVASDHHAMERFHREAKATARLHHTNIVPVFEVGRDGDIAFYAMQFIQGQGLDEVIEELARRRTGPGKSRGADRDGTLGHAAETLLTGRLEPGSPESPGTGDCPVTEAFEDGRIDPDADTLDWTPTPARPLPGPIAAAYASISALLPGGSSATTVDSSARRQPFSRSVAQVGRQVAQGLAYAHSRGGVHRDIKPSNLLIDTAGVVWITDFGLAKAEDDGVGEPGRHPGSPRRQPALVPVSEGDDRVSHRPVSGGRGVAPEGPRLDRRVEGIAGRPPSCSSPCPSRPWETEPGPVRRSTARGAPCRKNPPARRGTTD